MIIGIGVDIVEIGRIEEMIGKHGRQFLEKVFTDGELAYCEKHAKPPIHFAGRWAAKEAFYKALPRECQEMSGWKSIEIRTEESRGPSIILLDKRLAGVMDTSGVKICHVSISHDKTVCVAMVVLEGKG